MTLQELEHIFRFQTTPEEDYVPKDQLDYFLINGYDRLAKTHLVTELESLAKTLPDSGYVFEGYRDRMPIFIVPEIVQPL
jgi:hypothetical protein